MGTLVTASPGGTLSNRVLEDFLVDGSIWVLSGTPSARVALIFAAGEDQSAASETTDTITGPRTLRFSVDFDGASLVLDFGGDVCTVPAPGLYDFECNPQEEKVTIRNAGEAV